MTAEADSVSDLHKSSVRFTTFRTNYAGLRASSSRRSRITGTRSSVRMANADPGRSLNPVVIRHGGDGACPALRRGNNAFVEKYLISSLRYDVPDESEMSRWARLPSGVRMTVGVCVPLLVLGGITAGVATMSAPRPRPQFVTADGGATADDPGGDPTDDTLGVGVPIQDPSGGPAGAGGPIQDPTDGLASAGAAVDEPTHPVPASRTTKTPTATKTLLANRVRSGPGSDTRRSTSHRPVPVLPVAEIPGPPPPRPERPRPKPPRPKPPRPGPPRPKPSR